MMFMEKTMSWYEDEFKKITMKEASLDPNTEKFILELIEHIKCYELIYSTLAEKITGGFLKENENKTLPINTLVNQATTKNKRNITILKMEK